MSLNKTPKQAVNLEHVNGVAQAAQQVIAPMAHAASLVGKPHKALPTDGVAVQDLGEDGAGAGVVSASTEDVGNPIHLAEGVAPTSDAPPAAAGSVPTGGVAGTAAADAGTAAMAAGGLGGLNLGLVALGVAGVGVAAASGHSASSTTAPAAPTVADLAGAAGYDSGFTVTSGAAVTVTVNGTALNANTLAADFTKTTANNIDTYTAKAGAFTGSETIAVSATETDAAGNTSTAGTLTLAHPIDNTAPVIQSMVASVANDNVVLTYDSPLGTTAPAASDFNVTVGSNAALHPSSVTVNGSSVTLGFDPGTILHGNVSVTYLPGSDAHPVQDQAGNPAAAFFEGAVADGYVRGASISVVDSHGVSHATGITTDANGNFFLPTNASGQYVSGGTAITIQSIVATGGVNIDTGIPNTVALSAPAGSTTINPLTTLVQAVIDASTTHISATDAANTVATSLGLTGLNTGGALLSYDPLSSTDSNALAAQQAVAQVATVVALAAGNANGVSSSSAASTVISNLASQIQTASQSSTTVDLKNSDTVSSLLTNSSGASVVSAQTVSDIATANTSIGQATSITAVSAVQSQYLDTIAPSTAVIRGLTSATDTGSSHSDGVTNNPMPTVHITFNTTSTDGTAVVAGNTLVLSDNGGVLSTVILFATDITNGYVDVSLTTPLGQGGHNLTATLTDQAGNSNGPSTAFSVTLDTTAPVAPIAALHADTGTSAHDGITSNGQIDVTGLETGAIWRYSSNAGQTWTTGSGGSFTLAAGSYSDVQVEQVDAAGNFSSATDLGAITVLTSAPTAATSLTSNISSGSITANQTVTLSGTVSGTPLTGDFVAVFDGSTLIGTATIANGAWSFTTPHLANASHSFTARVEDLAGNLGSASSSYVFSVNATVPNATAVVSSVNDTIGSVVQLIASGGVSNGVLPALAGSISGTLANGDQVMVYDNGSLLGAATVTGTTWSYKPAIALSSGQHGFTAVVQASGGNQGAMSSTYALTLDTQAPSAPSALVLAATSDSGVKGDGITNVTTPTLTGTAEAGASITLYDGSNVVGHATAGSSGAWSISSSALAAGTHSLSATASDAAGNVSSASTPLSLTIDTAAPGVSVRASGIDLNTAAAKSSVLSVTADANASVSVVLATTAAQITKSYVSDGFAHTVALTASDLSVLGQGAVSVTTTATDVAGNTTTSQAGSFTLMTSGPVAPGLSLHADTGSSPTDGITSNGQMDVSGLVVGDTWQYSSNAGQSWTTGTGTSFTLAANASYAAGSVEVRQSDAAGNVSFATQNVSVIVVDTATPAAPVITGISPDTGVSKSDGVTNINTGTLSGTAEANSVVSVAINGTPTFTTTANASGLWSVGYSNLPDGSYTAVATATDAAGNVSANSAAATMVVDTLAPAAPTNLVDTAVVGGYVNAAHDLAGQALTGTAEANSTVKIYDGSTLLGTTTANGQGAWSYTLGALTDATSHSYTATATDAAGNTGIASTALAFTVDTTAPVAPTGLADTAVVGGYVNATHDTAGQALTGTAEANSTVKIYDGSTLLGTTTANGQGAWSYTLGALTDATSHSYTATATDAAGNTGVASTALVFTVDTAAPAAPVILGISPDTGPFASDGVTNISTGTLSGTAEANSVVSVAINGTPTFTTTANASGLWSVGYSNLSDGSYTAVATATDAAGNVSANSAAATMIVDASGLSETISSTIGTDTGLTNTINSGGLTRDNTLALSGTVSDLNGVAASVHVFDGTNDLGAATVSNGTWSFTTAALSNATHSFTAVATDYAGNTTTTSAVTATVNATVVPMLQSATVNGNQITLTYSEALNSLIQPATSYFQVNGMGSNNGRTITDMAINGDQVVLTLREPVSTSDTMTLSYTGSGLQDGAGLAAATFSNQTVTNTTTTDVAPAAVVNANFSVSGSTTTITITYDEALHATGTAGLNLYLDGTTTPLAIAGGSISGETITLTVNQALANTDYVVASFNGTGLADSNGNAVPAGSVFIGGSDVNTIDLNSLNLSQIAWPIMVRANGGNDVLAGIGNNDVLNGGGGSDTYISGGGSDIFNLNESTRASDTVQVIKENGNVGSQPYFYDTVYAFDVSSATVGTTSTNDKLSLPSANIAANASHVHATTVANGLAEYSISNGILTFEDSSGNAVLINQGNLGNATAFLTDNLTNAGQTVAFQMDSDGNGVADSLFVYQNGGGSNLNNDVLIDLAGVTGVTLGTTAGQNVVQLVDTTAPQVNQATVTGNGLTLQFDEAVSVVDFAGLTLQDGNGSTLKVMTPSTPVVSGSSVTVATSTTLGANDYVLVTVNNSAHESATDNFGNTGNLIDSNMTGVALAGNGTVTVDLSGLTGNYNLIAGSGNDTLIGGSGNDQFQAGAGVDTMMGGAGANRYEFTQGSSPVVTYNAGTYTFVGGAADVISSGFTLAASNGNAQSGDYVQLDSANGNGLQNMTGGGGTAVTSSVVPLSGVLNPVLATDQGYFLQQGDYANGVFTDSATGADTLVVYDGDPTSGVSQTGLVIQHVTPGQLGTQGNDIYLSRAAQSTDFAPISGNAAQGQPFVTDVRSSPDTNTYAAGSTVTMNVSMSQAVLVTGSPDLQLVIGDAAKHYTVLATYDAAQSTSTSLVFTYTMQPGDVGQLAVGNLYLPTGAVIQDASSHQNAFLGINNTGNVQAVDWVYAAPAQVGTVGNDWITPVTGTDISDYAKLTAALSGLTAGAGGNRDLLSFNIVSTADVAANDNGGAITNGVQGTLGGRTFQILKDPTSHVIVLNEVDSTGAVHLLKTLYDSSNGGGFQRLDINVVDSTGKVLHTTNMTLVGGTYTDAIRNDQLIQGSMFGDTITAPANPSAYQIIWSDNNQGSTTNITGSNNGDSIDISNGNNVIHAGGGNDWLSWWGVGSSTVDGGSGNNTLSLNGSNYVSNLQGAVTEVLGADGLVHILVGSVDAVDIAKSNGVYTLTTSSQNASQNDMVVQASNIENLQVNGTTFSFGSFDALLAAPQVTQVVVPTAGIATSGMVETFTVWFNSAVTVSGAPELALQVGSNLQPEFATYTGVNSVGPNGETGLNFSYTVQPGDIGNYGIGGLVLNGGSITAAGNTSLAANLTLNHVQDTAGLYFFGNAVVQSVTGTGASEVLEPWTTPALVSAAPSGYTNFSSVNGGGGHDVLVIPVFGATSLTSSGSGSSFSITADGTTSYTLPTSHLPTGISEIEYVLTDANGNPVSGVAPVLVALSTEFFTDPVNGDVFVRGSYSGDTINVTDANITTATSQVVVHGYAGGDTITDSVTNSAVKVFMYGDGGTNFLNGGAGHDYFELGKGTDTMHGSNILNGAVYQDTLVVNAPVNSATMFVDASGTIHVQPTDPATGASLGYDGYTFSINASTGIMTATDYADYSGSGTVPTATIDHVNDIQFRMPDGGRHEAVIQEGTSGNDALTDKSINGGGNIFFGNGGADTITGGAGSDTIVLNQDNLTQASHVNGGGGVDTVVTNVSGYNFNGAASITGIEKLTINGTGNSVQIGQSDVLNTNAPGDWTGLFNGASHEFLVNTQAGSEAGNTVNLSSGEWTHDAGTKTYTGTTYDTYVATTDASVHLLVNHLMTQTIV